MPRKNAPEKAPEKPAQPDYATEADIERAKRMAYLLEMKYGWQIKTDQARCKARQAIQAEKEIRLSRETAVCARAQATSTAAPACYEGKGRIGGTESTSRTAFTIWQGRHLLTDRLGELYGTTPQGLGRVLSMTITGAFGGICSNSFKKQLDVRSANWSSTITTSYRPDFKRSRAFSDSQAVIVSNPSFTKKWLITASARSSLSMINIRHGHCRCIMCPLFSDLLNRVSRPESCVEGRLSSTGEHGRKAVISVTGERDSRHRVRESVSPAKPP